MLRRKLALYILLYTAGITAGFFMFERSRTIEAACFCAAVIAAVFLTDQGSHAGAFPRNDSRSSRNSINPGKHLNVNKEAVDRQKTILAIVFLAGFLMFAFRSVSYHSALSYVHDKNYIRGRVVSVSVKDDKLQMIIRNREAGPAKVLVTLDEKAIERSEQISGFTTDENLLRQSECSATWMSSRQNEYTTKRMSAQQDGHIENGISDSSGSYKYIGMMVEARGEYTDLSPAEDPGCFDYALYMKSKGVTIRFKAYILEVTDNHASVFTKARCFLYSTRESFLSRFSADTQGFMRGVIFGDKSGIDEDLLEEFNINSTGHILAVSGLHIGFLYGLLRFMTARKRTLPVSALIIAVILLYGEMTMWSPATVRACIVMTISLFSTHLRRRSDLLTSLSLAAFLILAYQPYQLFSSGFQLSFMALGGIAFLTGPLSSVTGEALAVMLAVQIGTLPVIAYSYCRINPLSILINIPVILLASVLVPLCILMLMMEASFGRVPAAGVKLAELISQAVIDVNHILGLGGSFSLKTAGPGTAVMIMIYVIVFGLASEWTRVMLLRKDVKAVFRQGILLLMPVAMLFSCLYDTISDDEIVFVSVGQGDCVHIRAEGHNALIDGGGQAVQGNSGQAENGHSKQGYNVGKSILMPYLMHGGTDAVEIALVTHLHADHYKGIEELAEVFPVGAIGIPADYRASLTDGHFASFSYKTNDSSCEKPEKGGASNSEKRWTSNPEMKVFYIGPDTRIDISDDVSIEVIWPVEVSDEPIAADDPNEHNTVYMIHYKEIKIMVTGDLLEEDEQEMIKYYQGTDTLECDILKVAHHGSKSSSSEAFLDAVHPEIAVIQCGRNNFYGHPHKQTLDRLEKRGIQIFRTDLSGAVGIDIHGDRISVELFRAKEL
ncbi:MAG: DNA internalization-related competence protein ComEC/Rec2 [Mogibacterium sp.]|nr:DNA internalization-related competence protein ComEC/Rec2 [Mogibacterium sp.]